MKNGAVKSFEYDVSSCLCFLIWNGRQRKIRRVIVTPSFARPIEVGVSNICCGQVAYEVDALRVIALIQLLATTHSHAISGNTDHPSEEHVRTAIHAVHPHTLLFDPGERAVSSTSGSSLGLILTLVGVHRYLAGEFVHGQEVGFSIVVDISEPMFCSVFADGELDLSHVCEALLRVENSACRPLWVEAKVIHATVAVHVSESYSKIISGDTPALVAISCDGLAFVGKCGRSFAYRPGVLPPVD